MSQSDKQRNPSSGSLQNGVAFGPFVSESRFGDGGNRNQLILVVYIGGTVAASF